MDEDYHTRHQVPDGIWWHESQFWAGKVSTLDHSWSREARDKPEAHHAWVQQQKEDWPLVCFHNAKSFSICQHLFVPEVFMCINFPEVKGDINLNEWILIEKYVLRYLAGVRLEVWDCVLPSLSGSNFTVGDLIVPQPYKDKYFWQCMRRMRCPTTTNVL